MMHSPSLPSSIVIANTIDEPQTTIKTNEDEHLNNDDDIVDNVVNDSNNNTNKTMFQQIRSRMGMNLNRIAMETINHHLHHHHNDGRTNYEMLLNLLSNGRLPIPMNASTQCIYDELLLLNQHHQAPMDVDDAMNCAVHLIMEMRLDSLQMLIRMNDKQVMNVTDAHGHTLLCYSCAFYDTISSSSSSCDTIVSIIGYIVQHMNKTIALKRLQIILRYTEISYDHLQTIGSKLVFASAYPITTCLELSRMLKQNHDHHDHGDDEYEALSIYFTQFSLRLLNSLHSRHLSALALEMNDTSTYTNALSVALSSRNIRFIAHPQVARIIHSMWITPSYLSLNDSNMSITQNQFFVLCKLLVFKPKSFFLLNFGRFLMKSIGFLYFLVIFTYFLQSPILIHQHTRTIDLVLFFIVSGFLINELVEFYKNGAKSYLASGWNVLDSIIYTSFVTAFIIRIIGIINNDDDNDDDDSVVLYAMTRRQLQQLYIILLSFNIVLLWIRFTFIFVIHSKLGPLIRMMTKMLRDVYNFLFILCVVILGFAFALHRLAGDKVESYQTVYSSAFTLYGSLLGNFDFREFQVLDVPIRRVSQFMLGIFLATGIVVLLNLLIAMLSETYASVQEQSKNEFIFGKAEAVWEIHCNNNVLPPPFNIIVYTIYMPLLCLFTIKRILYRIVLYPRKSTTVTIQQQQTNDKANVEQHKSNDSIVSFTSETTSSTRHPSLKVDDGDDARIQMSYTIPTKEHRRKNWYCSKCHSLNVPQGDGTPQANARIVRQWLRKVNGRIPKGIRYVNVDHVEQCQSCYALKHPISKTQLLRERISLFVFIITFWIPAMILLWIPASILYILDASTNRILDHLKHRIDLTQVLKRHSYHHHHDQNRQSFNHQLIREWVKKHYKKHETQSNAID